MILSNLIITDVIAANRLMRTPGVTVVRHSQRERWAIALKLEGKTVYRTGQGEVVCDKFHPVILPKGSTYSWVCTPGECVIIEFNSDAVSNEIHSFHIADNHTLIRSFSKIEKALAMRHTGYLYECFSEVYSVLAFLEKSAKASNMHDQKQKLLPALEYMTEFYTNSNISNDFLAGLCGVSTVHFRKMFESVYQTSPIRFLQNLRIEKAKSMLESDFSSIEQVAESVGYNSVYHFSKMFKLNTGISPSNYAKMCKKNTVSFSNRFWE